MTKESKLYVVVQQYVDGKWGVAQVWKLPYASVYFKEARKYRRGIIDSALRYAPGIWKEEKFAIKKITF